MANRKGGTKGATGTNAAAAQPTPQLRNVPDNIDNGEASRGTVTARGNQTATQPEPSPADIAIPAESEMAAKVISIADSASIRGDAFAARQRERAAAMADKAKLLSDSRQKLAEAADLFNGGAEQVEQAGNILSTVGVKLYRLRVGNVLSADELSSLLGDTFGFKMKGTGNGKTRVNAGDPNASATPFGQGETLRKRIVRAVQGHEYVNGSDPSAFYDGLEPEAVSSLLDRLEPQTGEDGKEVEGASLYTVFNQLSELKKANRAPSADGAFNPLNVAKMVSSLSGATAVDIIAGNQTLLDAYAELRDVLTVISNEIAKRNRKAA
jgi:hypothetical protein